jgi:hypothetical protein
MGDPKEALERDLEQTKSDLPGDGGTDLDQDVDDTVKQAVGKDDNDTDTDDS